MKWLIEVVVIGGAIWFVFVPPQPKCNCPELPKNYFIVETKETEMCVDDKRKTIVTKVTKQGKYELEGG